MLLAVLGWVTDELQDLDGVNMSSLLQQMSASLLDNQT